MSKALRGISALVALSTLAACADNSPLGVTSAPAFSKNGGVSASSGSSGGGSVTATKGEIRLTRDPLTTFLSASGSAKFESKGTENRLDIEVEHIPAGTNVVFLLGGVQVGARTANAAGEAEISLRGAAAPTTVAGLAVVVQTDAAAPIVKGSF